MRLRVAPNHPQLNHFSMETHGDLGIPQYHLQVHSEYLKRTQRQCSSIFTSLVVDKWVLYVIYISYIYIYLLYLVIPDDRRGRSLSTKHITPKVETNYSNPSSCSATPVCTTMVTNKREIGVPENDIPPKCIILIVETVMNQ